MKHIKKIVACGLALSAVAGTYAEIAPHTQTLFAENTEVVAVSKDVNFAALGLVLEAKVGDSVPVKSASGWTATVTDFFGKAVNIVSSAFTVTNNSNYTITYTNDSDNSIVKSFIVNVTGEVEAVEFEQNTSNFIPSEMFVGEKAYLPEPSNENIESYKVYVNDIELTEKVQEVFVFAPDKAASYSIRYEATLTSGQKVNKTFTVNVVNQNAYGLEVGYELSKAMPTTAELGEEVTLPTVKTFNKKNNNDPLTNYTKVEVFYVGTSGETPVEVENFKFTPTKKADGTNYYKIKYTINTVHSSFGNQNAEAITLTYQIRDVKDTTIAFEDLGLKTKALAGQTIKFTPKLKNEDVSTSTITVKVLNRNGDELATEGNNIKLTNTDGTYSFVAEQGERYTIKLFGEDNSGNTIETSGLVIYVYTADEDKPKLEDIEDVVITALADADEGKEQVKLTLPEASDTIAYDLTYTVTATNIVGNITYEDAEGNAKTIDAQNPLVAGDKVVFKKLANNESVVTVKVSDGTNETSKTYTAIAKDANAPTIDFVGLAGGNNEMIIGDTVTLPSVVVSETNILSTKIYFDVTVGGKAISTYGKKYTYDLANNINTISGVKFVAAEAGNYTVTVTAIDSSNNISAKVYTFEVASTTNGSMSIGKVPSEVEVYAETALPTPTFTNADKKWYIEVSGEDVPEYQTYEKDGKTYFVALQPGTFVVTYVTEDDVRSVPYTIIAKDTTNPTFTLDAGVPVPSQVPFAEGATSATITLPGFTSVKDSGKEEYIKSYKLTVKDPDAKTYVISFDPKLKEAIVSEGANSIVTYNAATNKFTLTASQNGTYTFKYEVTDLNGNTTSVDVTKEVSGEMQLVVGDIYAPTIDDTDVNIKTNYTYGDTFVANIKDLELKDNKTNFGSALKEFEDKNLTVALYSGSTEVKTTVDSDGNISLQNDAKLEVGDYRLVLTLKDEAGKKSTVTYNINVKAEETKSVSNEKVWGIVLICISVVVLGAVVVYFVVTRDKKAPATITKKEENNKSEQE